KKLFMSPNTLVINCDLRETRVALIEDGVIAELQIERAAHRGTVGNIVLGRVTRVLPGMQAAFIDVGMERAAFLHVEDLIRPDDFEAYLAGDFGEIDKSDSGKDAGRGPRGDDEDDDDDSSADSHGEAFDDDDDDDDDDHDDDDHDEHGDGEHDDDRHDDDDHDDHGEGDDDLDDDDLDDDDLDDDDLDDEADLKSGVPDDEEDLDDDDDDESEEEADSSELESERLATGAAAIESGRVRGRRSNRPPADDETEATGDLPVDEEEEEEGKGTAGRRRRRRRTPSSGGSGSSEGGSSNARSSGRARRGGSGNSSGGGGGSSRSRESGGSSRSRERGRSGGNGRSPRHGNARPSSRVSRSVPITDVVKEGDQVIVQISKEPIGTKGARVTSHVSLPGRYCVFLPTVDHIGISKRIGSSGERSRLRKVIEAMKPKTGGIIVRTVAAGLTKKSLKADLGYLMRLWSDVSKKVEDAKAPTILYSELDLVLKTARDLFTDEINKIVIDDKEQYVKLVRFIEMFLPERVKDIELYEGDEPIFDAYGIEDEITRALSRKVPLPSGGHLIMDQAEALSAIDVNTG